MDRDGQWSRRAFLGSSAVTAASLGGCLGSSDTGDTANTGDGYTGWIPSPASFGQTDHFEYVLFGIDTLRKNESEFDPSVYSQLDQRFGVLARSTGASYDAVRQYVSIGSEGLTTGVVKTLLGSFDTSAVTTSLGDKGYEKSSSVGDYDVYSSGEAKPVGVGEEGIVLAGDGGDRGSVETVLKARTGDGERYTAREDFRVLTDELGTGLLVSGGTNPRYESQRITQTEPRFVGQVAAGASFTVDGDTTAVAYTFVFESQSDVETGPVGEWLRMDRSGGLETPFTPGEVSTSGRVVTATGTTETAKLFL